MLHQPIRRTRPPTRERATYRYSHSKWGSRRKRRLYLYLIEPPPEKPFLPSNEVVRDLIARVPDVRILKVERFWNHDIMLVYGANKNPFTARARGLARDARNAFLYDLGRSSSERRDIPQHVQESVATFLSEHGLRDLQWRAGHMVAYDLQGGRHDSRVAGGLSLRKPFKTLRRMLEPYLPFYLKAAPM